MSAFKYRKYKRISPILFKLELWRSSYIPMFVEKSSTALRRLESNIFVLIASWICSSSISVFFEGFEVFRILFKKPGAYSLNISLCFKIGVCRWRTGNTSHKMIKQSFVVLGLTFTACIFTTKISAYYVPAIFTYYSLYSILDCALV